MPVTVDERQDYVNRLRPLANGLFNTTHTIVNNCELAEYVLQSAILDAFLERKKWRETMGFKDGLMRAVRLRSLLEIKKLQSADADWRGIGGEAASGDRLLEYISEQSLQLQRSVVMRYGCGMSVKQMSEILDLPPEEIRGDIRKFILKLEKNNAQYALSQSVERELAIRLTRFLYRPGSAAFDPNAMLRAFEMGLESRHMPKKIVSKTIRYLLLGLGTLICIVLFWVIAVLIER